MEVSARRWGGGGLAGAGVGRELLEARVDGRPGRRGKSVGNADVTAPRTLAVLVFDSVERSAMRSHRPDRVMAALRTGVRGGCSTIHLQLSSIPG